MATRRALEWIRTSKARLAFRCEILDLLLAGEVCPHREQASSVLSFVLWTIDSSITLAALAENSLTP